MKSMAQVIKVDSYLRVLDLRNNKIDDKAVKELLLPALKPNKALINLNLAGNPGNSNLNKSHISISLLKNIERLKNTGLECRPTWIDPKVLVVKLKKSEKNES